MGGATATVQQRRPPDTWSGGCFFDAAAVGEREGGGFPGRALLAWPADAGRWRYKAAIGSLKRDSAASTDIVVLLTTVSVIAIRNTRMCAFIHRAWCPAAIANMPPTLPPVLFPQIAVHCTAMSSDAATESLTRDVYINMLLRKHRYATSLHRLTHRTISTSPRPRDDITHEVRIR